jgi:hypothetical protein
MPVKLSALNGITDGISGALHSTVDTGTSASLPSFLHDGAPGQLVSATLDGSLAPIVAARHCWPSAECTSCGPGRCSRVALARSDRSSRHGPG